MRALFLMICGCASAVAADWPEIAGPSQGEVPPPAADQVVWRDDLMAAFAEAQKDGRPMFVTWRCLPCKQCADFDKDVLDGSASLTPLLQRFVTVRMIDASHLDERIFPYRQFQDLDLSWWGYFLSPDGRVYAVFGGKDHVSDSTRISEAALVKTMERVLAHHYDPRRVSWAVDGPAPEIVGATQTPNDLPGMANFKAERPYFAEQSCIHCHQVADVLNFTALDQGRFDLKAFRQPWPLPENVGLVVDRDEGLLVTQVLRGSAAEQSGLRVGDVLAVAGDRKLFGQADFRGVLHRAPLGDAKVSVGWWRDGGWMTGTLTLADGWRETELWWRKSVYDGVYGEWMGFFPIPGPNQGKGSMSFKPFMGSGKKAQQSPWWKTGLRPNMEIVSINGKSDDWNSRELLTWFKLSHEEGDRVTIRVKGGQEFSARLPLR